MNTRSIIVLGLSSLVATTAFAYDCPKAGATIDQERAALAQVTIAFEMPEAYNSENAALPIRKCFVAHLQTMRSEIQSMRSGTERKAMMALHDDITIHAYLTSAFLGEYYTSATNQTHLERITARIPLIDQNDLVAELGDRFTDGETGAVIELGKFLRITIPQHLDARDNSAKVGHFSDRGQMYEFIDSVYDQVASSQMHMMEMSRPALYEELKSLHNEQVQALDGASLMYDNFIWPDHTVLHLMDGIIR